MESPRDSVSDHKLIVLDLKTEVDRNEPRRIFHERRIRKLLRN